eukprot:6016649-Amphidinium_carterae.1
MVACEAWTRSGYCCKLQRAYLKVVFGEHASRALKGKDMRQRVQLRTSNIRSKLDIVTMPWPLGRDGMTWNGHASMNTVTQCASMPKGGVIVKLLTTRTPNVEWDLQISTRPLQNYEHRQIGNTTSMTTAMTWCCTRGYEFFSSHAIARPHAQRSPLTRHLQIPPVEARELQSVA